MSATALHWVNSIMSNFSEAFHYNLEKHFKRNADNYCIYIVNVKFRGEP